MRMIQLQILVILSFLTVTQTTANLISKSLDERSALNYRILGKRAATGLTNKEFQPKFIPQPDVQSYTVHTNIKYRFAVTTIYSRVKNPADVAQEVRFTVTVPESAFISDFFLIIKDKTYKANIKPKDEAQNEYDQAKQDGVTAGHVQLDDRDTNLFTISVNVEARSDVGFNLTYEQILQRTSGFYENHMNIRPGQVVDILDVIVNIEESASLTKVEVFTLDPLTFQYEELKNAIIIRPENKVADIRWTPTLKEQEMISANGMKGSLVVRYDIDKKTKPNELLVRGKYFVNFVAPNNLKKLPKYLIFVLDASGSMTANKLNNLKSAMGEILSQMKENDYISLVLFSEKVELWSLRGTKVLTGELVMPTSATNRKKKIESEYIIKGTESNIYEAIDFINKLKVKTSTNIAAALRVAVTLAKFGRSVNPQNEPIIFFLTDGEPNVEDIDPSVIINKTKDLNANVKCSIFSLALGKDANYKFLDALSKSNGGYAKKIYVASDTATQLTGFFSQISTPLMSNISLKYDQKLVNKSTITAEKFRNYFEGSEIVVAGKMSDDNQQNIIDVELNANYQSNDNNTNDITKFEKFVVSGKASSDSGPLERMWAFLRVKQLLDKSLIKGTMDDALKEEALALSLKYSFVTSLTSLVIVEPNRTTHLNIQPTSEQGSKKAYTVHLSIYSPPTGSQPFMTTRVPDTSKRGAYTIDDLTWLDKTGDKIMLPNSNFIISTDKADVSYESCKSLKGTSGHCRHMKYCLFSDIVENLYDYLAYHCVIDGIFAGVCCPDFVST